MADIASRRDALRQAAGLPGADLHSLVEAALTEIDAAIEAIGTAPPAAGGGSADAAEVLPESVRAERRLLHAVFQQAPVPLFLLEQDGTIRRANNKAADLLGAPSGYATGKSVTVFVDLPFRAAIQTLLAAVTRTGKPRSAACRMLTASGPVDVTLTAAAADLPGDPQVLIVTAAPAVGTGSGGPGAPGTARAEHDKDPAARPAKRTGAKAGGAAGAKPGEAAGAKPGEAAAAKAGEAAAAKAGEAGTKADGAAGDAAVAAMTRRLDTVTAVTRVLLDNSTFSEAVTLQRCARLLAGEIADWVLIDIERGGRLLRQFAAGPRAGQADQLARVARSADPDPDSVPAQVHLAGKSVLLAHPDDPAAVGRTPEGVPLLMMLGATSVICVPISDGTTGYGALTLMRLADKGPFGVADLALAEELGRHLAIAIRVDRVFRQRSQVAEALQASLLPARLPDAPGLEFAAAYIGATQFQEISGDFYDVFKAGDSWAIAVGDVCGKGQDAAAMTAAARHAIRAFTYVHDTPDAVLAAANQVLVAEDYDDRFVTASLALVRQRGRRVQVEIGSCGHPGPAVVRADGRVEILEGDGLPLGLFDDIHPGRIDLELNKGDLLFFYTDGVTEARAADLSFFEDRLADALAAVAGRPADKIVRAVQELVTTFSSGELKDDVTIVAVQVKLRLLVQVLDDLGGADYRAAGGGAGDIRLVDEVVLVEQGRPGRHPGLDRLGAGDIRLDRDLLHPAARVGPAHHAAAEPAVGGLGQQHPDEADDHQHPAGRVQVEERGVGGHCEGKDGTDADERQSCSGFHRVSFRGGRRPPSGG
ncbi:MAG TPA: SpoIIE family protein phosphatase [Trebonia sp.]|nr:SpoIIE family protein phosphatase [Trebonia sp.]